MTRHVTQRLVAALSLEEGHSEEYLVWLVGFVMIVYFVGQITIGPRLTIEILVGSFCTIVATGIIHFTFAKRGRRRRLKPSVPTVK